MKRNIKKLVSLVLVLAISLAISVPAFAAGRDISPKPHAEVANSNVAASGFIYGPWFGNGNEVWNNSLTGWANVASDVSAALAVWVPDPATKTLAGSIAIVAGGYAKYGHDPAHTRGTIHKTYREVKYSDGTFAWFESHYVVHTYLVDDVGHTYDLGNTEATYSGTSPMISNQ